MIDKLCDLCGRHWVDPEDRPATYRVAGVRAQDTCPTCIDLGLQDLAVDAKILCRKEEDVLQEDADREMGISRDWKY